MGCGVHANEMAAVTAPAGRRPGLAHEIEAAVAMRDARPQADPGRHVGTIEVAAACYSSSSSSIRRSARRKTFGSAPERRSASVASSAAATGSATSCSGSAASRCGPLRSTAFVVSSTRRSARDSTSGASWNASSAGFDSRRLHQFPLSSCDAASTAGLAANRRQLRPRSAASRALRPGHDAKLRDLSTHSVPA